jgi:hypothetical protein
MVVEFIGVTICATLLVLWFAYMSSGSSRQTINPIRSNNKRK